ncbi:diacylglycerol O-acyltransferase [Saitozyma sp. JCM 24511]|nr:diacylglycerol O-acyltransferase [Saitozyma sp. JCM 24511]
MAVQVPPSPATLAMPPPSTIPVRPSPNSNGAPSSAADAQTPTATSLPLAESDPETPRAPMAPLLPADKGTLRRRRSARLGTRDGIDGDGASGDDEKVLSGRIERPRRGKRSKSKDGKAESGHRGSGLSEARRKVREKMKSPLISGLKLDGIREQISKGVEVKFAPLHIPPHRRLQTAAVALWALLLPISLCAFLICMSFPPLWVMLIPYIIWIQFDPAPDRGGRVRQWARKSFVWKYFAQYYPCSIVKEADLPSDRPYLFGYHPHGIIGMGAFATFATDGTNFSEYFPGIKPHLLTLESNFKIPFYRDILMMHGVCSVSKRSCANILSHGPGHAITIVVGGAAESLSAHPGTADLTLRKRFGFIKMAIKEGADLVPVFSFGENDIYDQLANDKGSMVWRLQKRFQKMFGFTLPLFYGRGIFNYNYGLMPFRHPIVSVVGKPIHVEKNPNPPAELIQEVQQLYIDELMRIWHRYKDLYARNRTKELTLVE